MSSTVTKLLKQLKRKELLQLGRKIGLRLNDNTTKSDLVKILAAIVTQKQIQDFLPSGGTGKDAVINGSMFEKKCINYFVKKGFGCEQNFTKIKGMEFDIVGVKEKKGIFSSVKKVIVAECKNRPKVIMDDFDKFLGKYDHFVEKYKVKPEDSQGFIMTSGIFDPLVKNAALHHRKIKLQRI